MSHPNMIMVFDTGAKSIEEITDIIRNALLEKDKLITEDARKIYLCAHRRQR